MEIGEYIILYMNFSVADIFFQEMCGKGVSWYLIQCVLVLRGYPAQDCTAAPFGG